jgi:hypothetical protein
MAFGRLTVKRPKFVGERNCTCNGSTKMAKTCVKFDRRHFTFAVVAAIAERRSGSPIWAFRRSGCWTLRCSPRARTSQWPRAPGQPYRRLSKLVRLRRVWFQAREVGADCPIAAPLLNRFPAVPITTSGFFHASAPYRSGLSTRNAPRS